MTSPAPIMAGKRGLIMGVANERSISWGIASLAAQHGAELAFTYQGEALAKRVIPLAESVNSQIVLPCDVCDDSSMDATFAAIEAKWGKLDFIVHAIAWSDKNELDGLYLNTTRSNFLKTMDVSVFSFTAVAKRAAALMKDGGSMLTLSYLGAERVMPNYNVMGVAKAALEASVRYLATDVGGKKIRVNAISTGPIKTLAAAGIGDFRTILKWNELNSPMQENVSIEDVGGAALCLLSDLGRGITGEVLHVDAGYHAMGMIIPDKIAESAELLGGVAGTKLG